jgi:hypothetical protein
MFGLAIIKPISVFAKLASGNIFIKNGYLLPKKRYLTNY